MAGNTPRIPASNMKLLTTAAMLSERGNSHVFRTRLVLDGNRLIIVGDGDPALADPDLLRTMQDKDGDPLDVETLLDLWTSAIKNAGVEQIDELIVDDRIFDQKTMHPHWPDDQVERHYCAEVSGLNFHRNVLWLRPVPRAGRVDLNEMPAAPFLPISNQLKSGGGRSGENLIDPHRERLSHPITVLGNIKEPQVKPVEVTIHDPSMFTGRLLADRLARKGIKVASIRRPEDREVFQGRSLEFDVVTPLETVARECNPRIQEPVCGVAPQTSRPCTNGQARLLGQRRRSAQVHRQRTYRNSGRWTGRGGWFRHEPLQPDSSKPHDSLALQLRQ